jgi:hypothetical protein
MLITESKEKHQRVMLSGFLNFFCFATFLFLDVIAFFCYLLKVHALSKTQTTYQLVHTHTHLKVGNCDSVAEHLRPGFSVDLNSRGSKELFDELSLFPVVVVALRDLKGRNRAKRRRAHSTSRKNKRQGVFRSFFLATTTVATCIYPSHLF